MTEEYNVPWTVYQHAKRILVEQGRSVNETTNALSEKATLREKKNEQGLSNRDVVSLERRVRELERMVDELRKLNDLHRRKIDGMSNQMRQMEQNFVKRR